MIINDEEKNAFTQSVMGDTEGGGGGSSVSSCECEIDFNTGRVELLEKASVLYEQKKNGVLIAHYKMNISETNYQEIYMDIFACSHSTNGTASEYNLFMNFAGDGLVGLIANSANDHPVGYVSSDNG